MEAQRSKNFKEFYRSTGEHSVNIRGHVRLTLLGLYPGWTKFWCCDCAVKWVQINHHHVDQSCQPRSNILRCKLADNYFSTQNHWGHLVLLPLSPPTTHWRVILKTDLEMHMTSLIICQLILQDKMWSKKKKYTWSRLQMMMKNILKKISL